MGHFQNKDLLHMQMKIIHNHILLFSLAVDDIYTHGLLLDHHNACSLHFNVHGNWCKQGVEDSNGEDSGDNGGSEHGEEGKSSSLTLVLGEGTMLSILDGDGAEMIGVSGVTQG